MRTTLANAVFGRVRAGILTVLYGQPEEWFYLRQIARSVGTSVGAVQRELATLTELQLIVRRPTEALVYFRANQESPVFPEIQSLLRKTLGVFHVLTNALRPVSQKIDVAFVYGSFARGEETAGSDIDMLIVGSCSADEVISALADLDRTLGRALNPTVYSRAEFRAKLAGRNHFLDAVTSGPKTFLFGDEHELRKVGGIRLAEARADKLAGDRGAYQRR